MLLPLRTQNLTATTATNYVYAGNVALTLVTSGNYVSPGANYVYAGLASLVLAVNGTSLRNYAYAGSAALNLSVTGSTFANRVYTGNIAPLNLATIGIYQPANNFVYTGNIAALQFSVNGASQFTPLTDRIYVGLVALEFLVQAFQSSSVLFPLERTMGDVPITIGPSLLEQLALRLGEDVEEYPEFPAMTRGR